MRSLNRAALMGRIGNEVVIRHTRTGKAVVNLNVATDHRKKDGDDVTTWHRVVLWDRLAEIAGRYLSKGRAVYVEGPMMSSEWEDKEGQKHQRTEITAQEMIMVGSRPDQEPDGAPVPNRASDGEELGESVGEIPF